MSSDVEDLDKDTLRAVEAHAVHDSVQRAARRDRRAIEEGDNPTHIPAVLDTEQAGLDAFEQGGGDDE